MEKQKFRRTNQLKLLLKIVSKKISNYKTLELKQNKNKKVLKKPSKKVKRPSSKKLFNNPFDQLKNINVK